MSHQPALNARFDASRDHLRQVAFRMLGSLDEADDAVQQTWLRADRADLSTIENLGGWLTTVTARVCLDMLRTRRRRAEHPLPPTVDALQAAIAGTTSSASGARSPEDEAVMAESVGLALLVVLDRLSPAQRVAFVLHDLFAVPFDQIAEVVDRSTVATKKLASRARERVRGQVGRQVDPPDRAEHRAIVQAFLAATRDGDLETLLRLLAPDVVRRADPAALPTGAATAVRGARTVAEETRVFATLAHHAEVALVDGAPGIVVAPAGRLVDVLRITIARARITAFEVIADPVRLGETALAVFDDG
jgi:RNA polymerase sigma-70 factor (ECF subfamily)